MLETPPGSSPPPPSVPPPPATDSVVLNTSFGEQSNQAPVDKSSLSSDDAKPIVGGINTKQAAAGFIPKTGSSDSSWIKYLRAPTPNFLDLFFRTDTKADKSRAVAPKVIYFQSCH